MANIKHAVVGTDMLLGSRTAAYLKSVVFYKDGSPAAIDNGNIVVIGDAIGPETYKAEAPAADSKRPMLALVAGVELFYDETRTHYLTEWENEAGKPVRVYLLVAGADSFRVTAEAFDGTPEKGKFVAFAAGSTKLKIEADASADNVFGVIKRDPVKVGFGDGQYTYYIVDVIA